MSAFKNLIRDALSPDNVVIGGLIKSTYSDSAKNDIRKLLAAAHARGVLQADMDNEIWELVFKSLRELRQMFVVLSGQLTTATSREIKPCVDYLTDILTAYLSEHEASYMRFMAGPLYPGMAAPHKERNWPELGDAAEDLIALRTLIFTVLGNLNAFAEGKNTDAFRLPENRAAQFWANYARNRAFCPKCGFNMYYAYKTICPSCFPTKVPDFVDGSYGRARR